MKPSRTEEEFFVKEEKEKKHRLHGIEEEKSTAKSRSEAQLLHHMKCPKCGDDLKTVRVSFVDIEECPGCGAMVLDKGEFDKLKTADNSVLKSLLEVFRKDG